MKEGCAQSSASPAAMKEVHVLMLPLTSQGHLTPMLQLSRLLASQPGFLISIALTPNARARFDRASSPLSSLPNLHAHTLHDGLPDLLLAPSLQQMIASLPFVHQSLDQLLQALMASPSPVTCLIADTMWSEWAQELTRKFNIPHAELWTGPASVYCCGVIHDRLLSAGLLQLTGDGRDRRVTCIPGLLPVRASDYMPALALSEKDFQADADNASDFIFRREFFGKARSRFRILINSIHDLETQAVDALLTEKIPALTVGPLFLITAPNIDEADKPDLKHPSMAFYEADRTCVRWLDTKAPASTLYMAFGSECEWEKRDMQELAYGLEASGHNFLWVIRPGSVEGDDMSTEEEDGLPQGFRERVGERGMVVPWAPQTDVLAHAAVGGFLSHCGWNSILESLWLGVPMLALPQGRDQGLNMHHVVEEWKVGLEIMKNEEGKICRNAVETGVRSLLGGAECGHFRHAVKEVKEIISKAVQEKGSSQRALHQFVEDLRSLR